MDSLSRSCLLFVALLGLATGCESNQEPRPESTEPASAEVEPTQRNACTVESTLAECQTGCENGSAEACWTLHARVSNGEGGAEALAAGRQIFERACRAGVASHCNSAVDLILLGGAGNEGASELDALVVEIVTLGCDLGSPSSCQKLGTWYRRGEHGLATNFDRQVRVLRRACELGDSVGDPTLANRLEGFDPFVLDEAFWASMACGFLEGSGPRILDALAEDCEKLYEGDLVINDVEGLAAFQREGWTCVSHNLTIEGVSDSTSLAGLESLLVVKNRVDIRGNPSLVSLQGLDNLHYVRGGLTIADNPTLASLEGLSNLTTVGNDLVIEENQALGTLRGLGALTRVGLLPPGSSGGGLGFRVAGNERLLSLEGLEGLAHLPNGLRVVENANIETLGGLDAIATLGQLIWLIDNPRLNNIHALDGIESLHVPSSYLAIIVRDNPALPACRVDRLLARIGSDLAAEVVEIDGLNQNAGCADSGEQSDSDSGPE